jgi:syntaxin 16
VLWLVGKQGRLTPRRLSCCRDIDYLTQEITAMFREAETILKRLPSEGAGGTDSLVTRNIQKSMAKRIQTLSMSFRRSQKEYMAQLKVRDGDGVGGWRAFLCA